MFKDSNGKIYSEKEYKELYKEYCKSEFFKTQNPSYEIFLEKSLKYCLYKLN
jgi:hypothetical protein